MPLLIITLTAIGLYSMSLAPIAWVLISEIFPNRIRGAAVSVCRVVPVDRLFRPDLHVPLPECTTRHGGNVLVVRRYLLHRVMSSSTRRVPETKGKTLEQIERELVD